MKGAFDFLAAAVLLIIFSPVMLLVSAGVRTFLGSPVLFRQMRPGLQGRPFAVYKFRTMTDQCNAEGFLLPDEFRLTRFGRFLRSSSLDELPQLFNVLKGELSLVGPRPLLMEYLPLYSQRQMLRHEVKPGITGWAQVHGRNAITWEERFELDVWYVEHRSFLLDMKIIMMTVWTVLKRDGVSQKGQATMNKFTGSK